MCRSYDVPKKRYFWWTSRCLLDEHFFVANFKLAYFRVYVNKELACLFFEKFVAKAVSIGFELKRKKLGSIEVFLLVVVDSFVRDVSVCGWSGFQFDSAIAVLIDISRCEQDEKNVKENLILNWTSSAEPKIGNGEP